MSGIKILNLSKCKRTLFLLFSQTVWHFLFNFFFFLYFYVGYMLYKYIKSVCGSSARGCPPKHKSEAPPMAGDGCGSCVCSFALRQSSYWCISGAVPSAAVAMGILQMGVFEHSCESPPSLPSSFIDSQNGNKLVGKRAFPVWGTNGRQLSEWRFHQCLHWNAWVLCNLCCTLLKYCHLKKPFFSNREY